VLGLAVFEHNAKRVEALAAGKFFFGHGFGGGVGRAWIGEGLCRLGRIGVLFRLAFRFFGRKRGVSGGGRGRSGALNG